MSLATMRRLGALLWLATTARAICHDATVTALTGRLNLATYIEGGLDAGDKCTYAIKPSSSSSMQTLVLVFEELQCDGCEIFLYEGEERVSEAQLWRCVSCGEVLPPPFYLTSKTAALITFSAPRGGASGFKVRYLAHTDDMGERADGETYEVELKMAQGLMIAPQTAGGKAPRPLLYDWKINPKDCTECDVAVYVEAAALREGDTVTVSDGEGQLARWTHADFPEQWVYGRRGNVMVQLSAPGSASGSAEDEPDFIFRARYVAAGADACHVGSYCSCGEHGALDEVSLATAPSALLTDGSSEQGNMLGPDACEWLVAPSLLDHSVQSLTWPPSSRSDWTPSLIFVAERVSVKYEGSVRVYDGNDENAPLLWSCAGCQFTAPPPLEASGDALYVEYVSGSGSAYYTDPVTEEASEWTGWQAIYWTETIEWDAGAGSKKVELVGGAATSVRAPQNWKGGLDYRWVVRPAVFGGSIDFLAIAWNALSLDCGDVVQAYGGAVSDDEATWALAYQEAGSPPLLKTWDCSSDLQAWLVADAFTSPPASDGITLRLLSQSTSEGGAVDFAYYSDAPKYRCGHVREPGVLTAASFVFGDGSAPNDAMAASLQCEWLVRPEPVVSAISLAFYRVDLGGGRLRIYKGENTTSTLLWDCAGCEEIPPILHASSHALYVTLETEAEPDGLGFEARYYASFAEGRGVGDGELRLAAAAAPSVRAPYVGATLAAGLDLKWHVDVGGGSNVLLVANAIDLPDCAQGSLTIYDGSVSNDAILDTFCGTTSTKWLASSGPEMILRLQTFTEIAGRGFDVAYFSDRPQQGCGAHLVPPSPLTGDDQEWWASSSSQQRSVLRASSFLFSDGSAPDAAARPSQDCEWILAPPVTATTRVVVAFPRLDLGDAGSLNVTQADTGAVLFSCAGGGCDAPPPPLSVACGSLAYADRCAIRVAYSTVDGSDDTDWGTGFLAHYFVASAPNTETDKVLLQTPGTDEGFAAASEDGSEDAFIAEPGLAAGKALPRLTLCGTQISGAPRHRRDVVPVRGSNSLVDFHTGLTAAWRAELAPETSLSVRMDDRLEVVQQRQVEFVDGHAAIPPRASLETEIQRHCGTVNAPAVLERHRYALPSASDELTYTTSSTTKAWALGQGNATLAYPDCGWAASATEAVTYVDVSFDAPLQLRQGISFAVYGGDTPAGQLVFLCEDCRDRVSGAECCTRTLRPLRIFCGRVLTRLYVSVGTNLQNTSVNVRLTAGPARESRPYWELCWDDPLYGAQPVKEKKYRMPTVVVVVLAVGGFLALVMGISGGIVFRGSAEDRRKRQRIAVARGRKQWAPRAVEAAAVAPKLDHARHYGRLFHEIQNRLLTKKGSCCICYAEDNAVIHLQSCNHDVCVGCMRSYCHAALGDISMLLPV